MQVGLRLAKIRYENQKVVELKFKDHYVGEGYPDLIVHLHAGKIVVELKAVGGQLGVSEEQQLKNYMKILKIGHGLLINFQQPGEEPEKDQIGNKGDHRLTCLRSPAVLSHTPIHHVCHVRCTRQPEEHALVVVCLLTFQILQMRQDWNRLRRSLSLDEVG